MLVVSNSCRFYFRFAYAILFITSHFACIQLHASDPAKNSIHEYFESIEEQTSIEEVVSFLVSLKSTFEFQGVHCPKLADICLAMKDKLYQEGIPLDQNIFQTIFKEIVRQEDSYFQTRNDLLEANILLIKSEKEGIELPSKMTYGFLKCIAGGLVCIVPIPGARIVGGGLIISGINDCIDSAREIDKKNNKDQQDG